MSETESIKLAVRALLEVVESGSKNVEVAVVRFKQPLKFLNDDDVDKYVAEIEKQKQEEEEQKKKNKISSQDAPAASSSNNAAEDS